MEHRIRTDDVLGEAPSFRDLLLPAPLVKSLEAAGYVRPSPVQQAAIPLARLGLDVVIQAKAGTGKTLVFAVAMSELIDRSATFPQALVLAPTREVALQAADVVADADAPPPGAPPLAVATLIGGLPTAEDERVLRRRCHAVVGTPGRVLALIQRGSLVPSKISILVLDEADKLLGPDFWGDVGAIIEALPPRRQTLALSATVSPAAAERLRGLMTAPHEVLLSPESTSLLGVSHFFRDAAAGGAGDGAAQPPPPPHALKRAALLSLLSCVAFNQAIVFCNSKGGVEALAEELAAAGHAAAALSSRSDQLRRLEVLNGLRSYALRVVVATDVAARGVDLDRVNLVVNVDLPPAPATLAHRVGRAGRFGTVGAAVTLVCGEQERRQLEQAVREAGAGEVRPLPDPLLVGWTPAAAAAADAAGANSDAVSRDAAAGHPHVQIVSNRGGSGVGAAQGAVDSGSAPSVPAPAPGAAEAMEAEILGASLWPEARGPLPTPGPEGWPLQLSDLPPVMQAAPPAAAAAAATASASASSAASAASAAELDFYSAEREEAEAAPPPPSLYEALIESLRLDLQRSPEAAAAASEALKLAFLPFSKEALSPESREGDDEEAAAPAAGEAPRRRRPLGSAQASAYERQLVVEERERSALEEEAALLEAMAEGEYEGGGTPGGAANDAAAAEAAWRQYWIDHYNQHGYWPGGAPEPAAGTPAPDPLTPQPAGGAPAAAAAPPVGGWSPLSGQPPDVGTVVSSCADADASGYVRVPAAVLRRYLQLEWDDWQRRFFGHI